MKNIFLFGECMIELMKQSSTTMRHSFAGDVFNTAVYLKRTFLDLNVKLVTCVGKDQFSHDMITFFESENIETDLVFESDTKLPGMYAIQLDEQGERSFMYWRDNSAARQVMRFIDKEAIKVLSAGDVFFFSGISLAVITPETRPLFWQLVDKLKAAGVQIVFDPNYRARLWSSPQEAQSQFELALAQSDLSLPGVDDFEQLFGMTTMAEVQRYCESFNIPELIIKNGERCIFSVVGNKVSEFDITPVQHVVDTTSAGDSFNGVYLGARTIGYSVADAIAYASKVAGFVIQHKGAIVDKRAYQSFIENYAL